MFVEMEPSSSRGRKRSRETRTNLDAENPRNWTKTQLITELQNRGIDVPNNLKTDMLRQMFLLNKNKRQCRVADNINGATNVEEIVRAPSAERSAEEYVIAESVVPAPAQNVVNIQEAVPVAAPQQTTSAGSSSTRDESISAIKAANEALANMVGLVKDLVASKDKTSEKEGNCLKTAMMATFGFSESDTNAASCSQTFIREVKKTGIIFAEDLPSLDHVSPTIRKQILEGKDVNLTTLLSPQDDTPQTNSIQACGVTVNLSTAKDKRLSQNLTLDEFNTAFRKYRRVMCKAYPQRREELDQYEDDINELARTYGSRFYSYHKKFSAKAATAILEHNIVISWAKVDDTMLNKVMHGVQSNTCEYCGDVDHTSKFCQTQRYFQPDANKQQINNTNHSRTADKHGRAIQHYQGREICNNFNTNTCKTNDCSFAHVCLRCKSPSHTMKACDQQPRTPNNASNDQ